MGLAGLAKDAVPSEESLLQLEKMPLHKAAREKGRARVGSTEGEDLQLHVRPIWSRIPKLDAPIGSGTLEEKMRSALEARKHRTQTEKITFLGLANFLGHVQDWGFKMIMTKVKRTAAPKKMKMMKKKRKNSMKTF